MIRQIFFDTDCISAFFWVGSEHFLPTLYPGRLNLPRETYGELSKVPHLQAHADAMISINQLKLVDSIIGSKEHEVFIDLIYSHKN